MKIPLWVAELAEEFWKAAKEIEPFPCNLPRPNCQGSLVGHHSAAKLENYFRPKLVAKFRNPLHDPGT